MALAAGAAAGCAKPPTMNTVLKSHYPGYGQIAPWAEVNAGNAFYPYVPGTLARFQLASAATRSDAAAYDFTGDYCSTGQTLGALKPTPTLGAAVVYDFDVSLRRRLERSTQRAAAELSLNEHDLRYLRRVVIRVTNARVVPLRGLRGKPLRYAPSCLEALAGTRDLYRIDSVLIGDVSVDIAFKTNIDLSIRSGTEAAILSKVQFALGFGYFNVEGSSVKGTDVVFGARLAKRMIARAG